MKKLQFLLLVLLLAACSGGNNEPGAGETGDADITYETDEATGLPFNPSAALSEGQFIVEGEVIDVSLIPQDKPVFKITTPQDVTFNIVAQPLSTIVYEDGTEIALHEFRSGMFIRATVWLGDDAGVQGEPALTSEDLVILVETE